jgi:prefoldin subunit 5
MAPEAELSALRTQADWLKSQLDAISKRIEELEKEA